MDDATPFLMYHELLGAGRTPSRPGRGYARYVIAHDVFAAHLRGIRDAGARGTSVSDALAPGGDARVAITFDDGCASDLLVAAPLLEAERFGATCYITTAWLGTAGWLTRHQVKELHGRGVEIGSHSVDHPYLTDLQPEGIRTQLVQSREVLEDIIGAPVRHFSCPGGRWSPAVADIAREAGYLTVTDSTTVPFTAASDRYRIGRYAVTNRTSEAAIARLVARGAWGSTLPSAFVLRTAKKVLGNRLYDRVRSAVLDRTGD